MLLKIDKRKLYLALAAQGIGTTQLMALAKISAVTVQRISDGKPIRPTTAGRVAAALGVTAEQLLE